MALHFEYLEATKSAFPMLTKFSPRRTTPLQEDMHSRALLPGDKTRDAIKRVFLRHNAASLDERTVHKYRTKEKMGTLDGAVDTDYARQFYLWLRGGGKYQGAVTVDRFYVDGVVDVLRELSALRFRFLSQLNRLRIFQPHTLLECEMYFKYIVLEYGVVQRRDTYVTLEGMLAFVDDFNGAMPADPADLRQPTVRDLRNSIAR